MVAFSPAEVCKSTPKCVGSLTLCDKLLKFSERLIFSERLTLVICREEIKHTSC